MRQPILIISILLCMCYLSSGSPVHNLFGGSIAPNIHAIGTADGKTYLSDDTPRNWSESGKFCQTMGMTLASVETQGQVDLWENAHDYEDFGYAYWTAGRDAQTYEQFLWNNTETKLPLNLRYRVYTEYQTCILYEPLNLMFYMSRCNIEYGVICEVRIGDSDS